MFHGPVVPMFVAATFALLSGGLFVSTVGFGIAWIRARERAIRAEHGSPAAPGGVPGRFDRLDQAIEAVAVEVERLGEAQRFQSTLLADRIAAPARPAPARVVTPH